MYDLKINKEMRREKPSNKFTFWNTEIG